MDAKDNNVFDFAIFTRRRSVPLSLSSILPDITSTTSPGKNTLHNNNKSRRPRPWLQFGSGGSRKNELGVRETYQFYNTAATATTGSTELPNNEVKVRYTRYGEAPVWYGPGRVCLLELVGTRIDAPPTQLASTTTTTDNQQNVAVAGQVTDTIQQQVPVITSVISKYIPDFWNLLPKVLDQPPRPRNNNRRTRATTIYRKKHTDETNFVYYANALHASLQLQEDETDGNEKYDMYHHQRPSTATTSVTTTAEEYQQYYHDLAIGRQVQELLTPLSTTSGVSSLSPPQQLLQRLEYERRQKTSTSTQRSQQVIRDMQGIVFTTWDKLRTASTLSLW